MTWSTESRHARGYDSEWDRLRLVILRRDHGLCQCSECKGGRPGGRITAANEVHHVVPKAKAKAMGWTRKQTDHPTNLHAINETCHKRETAAEQGKTLKPKGHDSNGFPTSATHPWNTAPGGRFFGSKAPPEVPLVPIPSLPSNKTRF